MEPSTEIKKSQCKPQRVLGKDLPGAQNEGVGVGHEGLSFALEGRAADTGTSGTFRNSLDCKESDEGVQAEPAPDEAAR